MSGIAFYDRMNGYDKSSEYPRIEIRRGHERRALRGHPWIFSNELAPGATDFEPGQLVRVFGSKDRFIGVGYINPHSLITVRLLRRSDGPVDESFLSERLHAALEIRSHLYRGEEVVRLVYSEGDALPGLIVDRYGDHLAVQVTTAGMEKLFPSILPMLVERLNPICVVARNDISFRELEGLERGVEVLYGEPDQAIMVDYEGLRLSVDLLGGQKTGLFLDQRDNQRMLLPGLAGGEVLDCYCYQGIWSLLALRADAVGATGVDTSADALQMAADHAERNGLADRTKWVQGDVLDTLKEYRSRGQQFHLVILDPPAYVKGRKHLKEGLRGYLDLNRKGIEVVAPGGFLITSSCSHHVRPETFMDSVAHAAGLAGRHVRVIAVCGQSRDHPPLLTAPETSYLKCIALHVE